MKGNPDNKKETSNNITSIRGSR